MQLVLTPDAAERVRRDGGTVALDFVRAVG
jgi:hypothetical protein